MSKPNLKALNERYPSDKYMVVELRDPFQILKMYDSMCAAAWANGPLPDTGYHVLIQASPRTKGERSQVFVCTDANAELLKLKHPYYDQDFRGAVKLVYDPTAPMHDSRAPEPQYVVDLIDRIKAMRKSFPHNWITGRVAHEVLLVANGADPAMTFTT